MPAHHAIRRPLVVPILAIARAMAALGASVGHLLPRCSDTPEKLSASDVPAPGSSARCQASGDCSGRVGALPMSKLNAEISRWPPSSSGIAASITEPVDAATPVA